MTDDRDYEIGYKKPPRKHQFKRGRSGNPRGRPRKRESMLESLNRELDKKIRVVENGREIMITKREAAIKTIANKLAKGDLRAFKLSKEIGLDPAEVANNTLNASGPSDAKEQLARSLIALRLRRNDDRRALYKKFEQKGLGYEHLDFLLGPSPDILAERVPEAIAAAEQLGLDAAELEQLRDLCVFAEYLPDSVSPTSIAKSKAWRGNG